MIPKDKLKGFFVTYLDKQSKYRTQKVVKINGLRLTVKDALGERKRIHPKETIIFGVQRKNKIEEIQWTNDGLPLKGQKRLNKSKQNKEVYND